MSIKFGRSLSFCIKDIASGKVNENDVQLIVTSTRCKNRKEFVECLNHYALSCWIDNPDICMEIALRLYDSGKIEQPRLKNDNMMQALYIYPIWGDSFEDVHNSLTDAW